MKKIRIAALVLFVVGGLAVPMIEAQQAGIKRTPLQQVDLSIPNREVVQVRVDFEPGASFPDHTHPGEEIVLCPRRLAGVSVDGQPPRTLKADDRIVHPGHSKGRTS